MSPPPPLHRGVMSGTTVVPAEGVPHPRKVRRNIHSCVECKRRKVRCELSTEKVTVCVGCHSRGIACVVQQAPREDEVPSAAHFDEKLARIESLLMRLVQTGVSSASGSSLAVSKVRPGNALEKHAMRIVDSASIAKNTFSTTSSNNLHYHHEVSQSSYEQTNTASSRQLQKLEEIRRSLSTLLPSQHDADVIGAATNGWALSQVFCTPANELFKDDDPLSSFNLVAVSTRHPTIIARTLLYIAICIQQLPPGFDMTQLHLISSLDAAMDNYVSAVVKLVTSDDEIATTIEGLECLLLQGLFHLNAGSLRRAWLSFRRSLNISQLMCLDKAFIKARKGLNSASIKVGKQMWHQVVMSDRYVSLLLGLPCGTGDGCFGPEETLNGASEDVDLIFERRLSLIAGRISNRNQIEPDRIFAQTQVIDEDMDRLAKEMQQSWWYVPELDRNSRSRNVAQQFNRLTTQIWYYQLETFLHLPFMLRATTESRYEYNRHTCLAASREILFRYLALRNANNTQLHCRVVDFAAFIASVVIALASIHTSQLREGVRFHQHNEDIALLQEIIASMESLAESSEREIVASQSVVALRALLRVNDLSGTSNGSLRLTIPYFGTINITRQTPIQNGSTVEKVSPFQNTQSRNAIPTLQHSDAVPHRLNKAGSSHAIAVNPSQDSMPIISFISSQFRSSETEVSAENWEWQEGDSLFFDSLLSSDIGEFDSF